MSSRVGWPVVGVLALRGAAALFVGNCGGSASSPSPVASSTPTPTPAPVTPITPVPVAPQPSPAPGSPNPNPTPTTPPSSITINMSLSIAGGYSPSTANVRVGQQIFWHNTDPTEPHTATNHGPSSFNTGLIPPGGTSGPITLSTSGTFSYTCDIHPTMVGTLNVTP